MKYILVTAAIVLHSAIHAVGAQEVQRELRNRAQYKQKKSIQQPARKQLRQNKSIHAMQSQVAGSIDYFVMAGQSNMIGTTTKGGSIENNDEYWMRIKSILDAGGDATDMSIDLYDTIYYTNSQREELAESEPRGVARTLTKETMKLYQMGLLHNLDIPLHYGSCSFVEPQYSGNDLDVSNGPQPTVWDANCGSIFGHELMFSRTMELEFGYSNHFEALKVAHGGTEIHHHWSPSDGVFWESLRDNVRSKKGLGNMKAFIWHQGTQESWTKPEDTSLTYMGNLTELVDGVRSEMFDASEEGHWHCKEEIPVIIVQLGHWPEQDRSDRVRAAQASFVAQDPKAELVRMNDLSRFYHFDAVSFLISGRRIAYAYQAASQASFTCPPPPPLEPINPNASEAGDTFWMDWDHVRCTPGKGEVWRTRYNSINECCSKNLPDLPLEECHARSHALFMQQYASP